MCSKSFYGVDPNSSRSSSFTHYHTLLAALPLFALSLPCSLPAPTLTPDPSIAAFCHSLFARLSLVLGEMQVCTPLQLVRYCVAAAAEHWCRRASCSQVLQSACSMTRIWSCGTAPSFHILLVVLTVATLSHHFVAYSSRLMLPHGSS